MLIVQTPTLVLRRSLLGTWASRPPPAAPRPPAAPARAQPQQPRLCGWSPQSPRICAGPRSECSPHLGLSAVRTQLGPQGPPWNPECHSPIWTPEESPIPRWLQPSCFPPSPTQSCCRRRSSAGRWAMVSGVLFYALVSWPSSSRPPHTRKTTGQLGIRPQLRVPWSPGQERGPASTLGGHGPGLEHRSVPPRVWSPGKCTKDWLIPLCQKLRRLL